MMVLSDLSEGSTVKISENGSLIEFYVAKHGYEPSLNGNDRTLIVRKDCYDKRGWAITGRSNAYASSEIDGWLNSTYKELLDPYVKGVIGTTTFYYTPGNGNNSVSTLSRSVFLLSLSELGWSSGTVSGINDEGSSFSFSTDLRLTYLNGASTAFWTRSPYTKNTYNVWVQQNNDWIGSALLYNSYGSRPCFTLPSDIKVSDNMIIGEGGV
jgi:hypothetical protein